MPDPAESALGSKSSLAETGTDQNPAPASAPPSDYTRPTQRQLHQTVCSLRRILSAPRVRVNLVLYNIQPYKSSPTQFDGEGLATKQSLTWVPGQM